MTRTAALLAALLAASPALAKKKRAPPADAGTPSAAQDKAQVAAQRVQRFYERAKDFSGRFQQTSTYPTFGNVKNASGKVFLRKPDLLRWEYDDGRLIVLDGKTLWTWNAEDKEATVKRGFGAQQVPAEFAFLFGKGSLLDRFSAREIPRPEGLPEGDALELVPRQPSPDVQKLVLVAAPDGQVRASVVTNSQGDTNQLVFSDMQVNARLPDALFRFEPPPGAHVTELK
jgi:outer membrane lipoprotein carrier protein